MKQGWEIKKLGEVCFFENGDRGVNYPSKSHRTETGIPFINAGHLTSSGLDLNSMDYISRERFNLLGSGKVKKGDILFCLRGSLGKFAKVQEFSEGAIASSLVIVRPKVKITSDFLMLYFESKICADMIVDYGNGAAQPNLSAGSLKNFEIPLPPLPEQQRIVAILDEVFEAIAKAKVNAEQNLKNAKELFESYLQNVFENKGEGWEEKTLKEIGIAQTGTTPKTADKENYGDFIPFVKPADIDIKGNGEIRYDNDGLSEQGLRNGRKMLEGSILMVCIGATIGKVGFVDRNVSCNQQINSLTVKKEFSPKFIYYALSTKGFFEQVILNSAQATLPIINKGKWETLTVSFPKCKSEQENFANKFDALQLETKKLEAIYQQKIKDLEELKKSVLQKAFAGELKTKEAVAV